MEINEVRYQELQISVKFIDFRYPPKLNRMTNVTGFFDKTLLTYNRLQSEK